MTGAERDTDAELTDRLVEHELRQIRARDRAREMFAAEKRAATEPFDAGTLAEILARPAPPPARVDELLPWEASTLVVAQRKTGKTTLLLNLARSLIVGEPFLGRFDVRPVSGEVAFLNYEVSAAQLARWADEAGVPRDLLYMVNLRGRRNPLSDPEDRARLAAVLRARGVEALIVDPFGRAFDGHNQNDAGEVGSWLVRLDQFARSEVGALDLILTAHAGWNGERSRGSTALEDWADSILTMTRDAGEDADGARYLRAVGRDVELEEDRLTFDPGTRQLTVSGAGSRRQATVSRRNDQLDDTLLSVITLAPGLNTSELERRLKDDEVPFQKGDVAQAAQRLEKSGRVRRETAARGAKLHFPSAELSEVAA